MKNKVIILSILATALVLYYFIYLSTRQCSKVHIAFDIGSGAFKSEAAIVDTCNNKLLRILDSNVKSMKFANCIEDEDGEKIINTTCIDQAVQKFLAIQNEYNLNCKDVACFGIATEWARQVKNTNELFTKLEEHGLKVQVVDQATEGIIGFNAAFNSKEAAGLDKSQIVVWDIGGASFQLSTLNKDGDLNVFEGRYGIEVFENEIRALVNRSAKGRHPYLTQDEISHAIDKGKSILSVYDIKTSLAANKLNNGGHLFAIGRPFSQGNVADLHMPVVFTKQDLLNMAYKFSGNTVVKMRSIYPNLPEHYATTAQVALIMMYLIMDALEAPTATVLDATMTRAIVSDPNYY